MRIADTLGDGSSTVPIGAVLAAIGRELKGLGEDVDCLQEKLSPAFTLALMAHPEVMIGLQELDRLTQTLYALSNLIQQIGIMQAEASFSDLSSLVASVPLGDLAYRLMQP